MKNKLYGFCVGDICDLAHVPGVEARAEEDQDLR